MSQALAHNPEIESKVIAMAKAGVTVKETLGAIQGMTDAPAALGSFYRIYGAAMKAAKASVTEDIGNVVIKQAKEGCRASQGLYLKSRGGWVQAQQVNVSDQDTDPDEDAGAANVLMSLLGKLPEEDSADAPEVT